MSSIAIPILDALTNHISGGTYSVGEVAAIRAWAPKVTRESVKNLHVMVVGDLKRTSVITRSNNQHDLTARIFVQKAVDPFDISDVDPLVELVEEIEMRVDRQSLAGASWVSQTEAELSDIYLWELRSFYAVFEVNYRVLL